MSDARTLIERLGLAPHPEGGWFRETWYCRSGCRRFFVLERNLATNRFREPPLPADPDDA